MNFLVYILIISHLIQDFLEIAFNGRMGDSRSFADLSDIYGFDIVDSIFYSA
jgi:hypothetical protein